MDVRTGVLAGIVAGAAALALLTPAAAQPRPCTDDVKRLCPDVAADGGSLANCLKPHEAELSPVCQRWLQRAERRGQVSEGRRRQIRTARALAGTPKPRARTPVQSPDPPPAD